MAEHGRERCQERVEPGQEVAVAGNVDLLKVPNSKISGPSRSAWGRSGRAKWRSKVSVSRKWQLPSPALVP
jgi:hypothetical protein